MAGAPRLAPARTALTLLSLHPAAGRRRCGSASPSMATSGVRAAHVNCMGNAARRSSVSPCPPHFLMTVASCICAGTSTCHVSFAVSCLLVPVLLLLLLLMGWLLLLLLPTLCAQSTTAAALRSIPASLGSVLPMQVTTVSACCLCLAASWRCRLVDPAVAWRLWVQPPHRSAPLREPPSSAARAPCSTSKAGCFLLLRPSCRVPSPQAQEHPA